MALEAIKNIYFGFEDKWYSIIDKIDEKIPIHGIIDRVDNVIPSFALFLIILVLLIGILVIPIVSPGGLFYSFKISDSEGAAVEGADIEVYVDGELVFSDLTNENGETGRASLNAGDTITVSVSKTGFLDYTETIEISGSVALYGIALELLEEKTYTIALKDSLGQPIIQPLTLSFSCRNSDVEAPDDMEVFSGVATVTEPAGCDGLIVSVRGEGFDFLDSVELVQNNQTIYMQESLENMATISVELFFEGQLISEEITVYLYKDNLTDEGLGPIESAISQNGIAAFEKQPGTYFVKSSGLGRYSAAKSQIFSLAAGDFKTVTLDLQRNVVGTINLRIIDSVTKGAVDGAKISLRIGAEEVDNKVSSADEEGLVEFPVSQDTAYTVIVDHEAYCLKTVHDITISSSVREIELKPFTADCGGKLKIKVLDQDGQPVRNATAGLYNEDKFSIGFAPRITDINGIVEFSRVPSGDYQAFAFKASSSGWSEVQHFIQRAADQTILTVVLIAGDGIVKVNVRDDEGNPLQFAHVAFVDALTFETIGGGAMPVQDVNGAVEITTRADKKIYIVASKEGYTNFTSIIKPVVAGTTQVFDAVLEREIIQGEIEILFKGLYKGGKIVSVMSPGQEYEALFEIRIPRNKSYDSIGMHVRTGDQEIMELDKLVLEEINAPERVSIIRATSYNPSNGYAVDSQYLSSDEAKWANLSWRRPITGLMQIAVNVRAKETATVGEQLNMYYRAWGVDNRLYKRSPLDNELGEAESISGKEGLYAKANQEIFQIGTETICDEKFCFSASILDLEDKLSYDSTDSFSGKVFRQYRLTFTILNNSEFETDSYLDAEAKVSNPFGGISLQNYSIYGAQSQLREGMAKDEGTGWVEVGNLLPNNMVSGTINFTPQNSGLSSLLLEIRSGQRIRFSKTISMNIAAAREMIVSVTPEMLPSGIENSITVSVKDKMTAAEIDEALIKAKDRFGTVVAERTTNSKGIATLTLPAMQPGEKLRLIIGKPDYETFEKTLEVNPDVIEVKPKAIGVALNAKTTFDTQDGFSIENLTSFDMKIKSLELNGKLYGLVDREKANNWLYSYAGDTIRAGELKEMTLLSFLTEKGKDITDARQLEASLDITVEAFSSEWLVSVPVKISVGLGGEVDDPTCFTITRKDWKAGTEGVPIEIEFEIQNNCSISSAPVSLRNIGAKVLWETNQTGRFSLRTATNVIDLRTGYYKKFTGVLGPEETISAVLIFSPNAGVNGKGIATVFLSAENPTESGAQLLEDALSAEITVVNLADCISFDKEVLLIKPERSDTFEVESIGCGVGNEITFESEITLSKEKVTLGENDSKEIEVFAEKNIAGQYPIKVYAKGSDEVQKKLIKTLRARILAGGCLELSKYEFDVFNNPEDPYDGYDTVEVINHCYEKPVTVHVKYDEHDWGEAIKTGALYGLVLGVIGGFASGPDNSFWTGAAIETAPASPPLAATPPASTTPYTPPASGGNGVWTKADDTLANPSGYAAATGGIGGIFGNMILGMGRNILGPPSFLNWGITGFMIGTVTAYMNQDEGDFSFSTIQRDLEYKGIELLLPGATLEDDRLVETPSTDIIVRDLEETRTSPRPDDPRMSVEKMKLGFLNAESVVQPDPATPLYRVLKVEGERIDYVTEYDLEENKHPSIEIKERKDHWERFRLQFNSFDPMIIDRPPPPIPNCTLGAVTGVTGPEAVPRVAFEWSWNRIGENACDEGNDDYIYCDATQFSIAVLQKVQSLKSFIEANKPFICPSGSDSVVTKQNPLISTAADVGITKLMASKVGESDVNLVAVVESNNGRPMEGEVRIDLTQGSSLVKSCTKQIDLISKSTVSCEFTNVAAGAYDVEATLLPVLCSECENNDLDNDSMEVPLVVGTSGISECEPYNTERLVHFMEASNYSQNEIEQVQSMIKFNAYLIKDAYTPDFRADFDEFCKTKSFFDCPAYYLENDGLHEFFSNSDRFKFDYSLAPHAPADAGKYAVTINIEFDNTNWDFFSEGQPEASITVKMVELSAPEPNNPFYYLPFDGLVGIDSANGRQGYGVNFRQTTEKTMKINNTIEQTILSTNIPGSTPIFNGWIDAGFADDFGILNQVKRGILLDVQSTSEATKVTLSPSYATPIMMEVEYEKGSDAYGFYSVEINNSPQTASMRMIPWSGVGIMCKDFADNPVTEAWQDTWDMHGGISGNMSCAIGTNITDYGVEWCNPMRAGKVFLQSVVFTPQNKSSIMKRTVFGDNMVLYNSTENGSQIGLNGVPGMANNSFGTNSIDSIEDVFDLVRENKVCLIGQGNRISNKFFWNPKAILEELATERTQAEQDCIQIS